jgi:hypothetical protein
VRQSDKFDKRYWLLIGLMGLVLILSACGGGSSAPDVDHVAVNNDNSDPYVFQPGTGIVPQGGDWTASQISFRVSDDGSLVESFEVSYSGRASNETCDFDYSNVVSLNDMSIENGRFIYDSDELVVEGRFTATHEAEVTVLWFGYYGGACEVFYNGELMEVVTLPETATD